MWRVQKTFSVCFGGIRVTVRVTTPKCGPLGYEIAVNKVVIMMMMTRCHLTPHRTYG